MNAARKRGSRSLARVYEQPLPGAYWAAQPPSIFQATPRTLLPAGEQKNTANAPNSSGVVNSREGSFSPSSSLVVSALETPYFTVLAFTCFCTKGVSTQPGQMALHVTPVVAFSSAVTLVKPTMPCLAATYALFCAEATSPCTDATLMMRPQPAASMAGKAKRVVGKALDRLMARMASHFSVGTS